MIEVASCSVYTADHMRDSGKSRGVCVYMNNSWCTHTDIVYKHCCPDLELRTVRCRPFFLPREFTIMTIMSVYIPPQAKATLAP